MEMVGNPLQNPEIDTNRPSLHHASTVRRSVFGREGLKKMKRKSLSLHNSFAEDGNLDGPLSYQPLRKDVLVLKEKSLCTPIGSVSQMPDGRICAGTFNGKVRRWPPESLNIHPLLH